MFLAIDLHYGNIYCIMCQSYVYDKEIDQVVKEESNKASQLKCKYVQLVTDQTMERKVAFGQTIQ